MNAETAQGTPSRAQYDEQRLPLWRHFVQYFFISAVGSIAWYALRALYRAGQPIGEIIIDAAGIATIYAVLMCIRREFEEK